MLRAVIKPFHTMACSLNGSEILVPGKVCPSTPWHSLKEVKYWYLEHPEHVAHWGSCPREWEVIGHIDKHIK